MYVAGANIYDGYSYKDINGDFWRDLYDADLNYPLSNFEDLGSSTPMFSSNGFSPTFVIIGKNSSVVSFHMGYASEDSIRAEVETALKDFGDFHLIEKYENIFLRDTDVTIDMRDKYVSLSGKEITYSIVSVDDETIASCTLNGSILTVSGGVNTGITEITVRAETADESKTDTFQVMRYPAESDIYGFEEENWTEMFMPAGESKWYRDSSYAYDGNFSLRSGYIAAPELEGTVVYSGIKVDFSVERPDTIAFAYKISSQYDSDGADFYIDGIWTEFPDKKWSGELDWRFAQYAVEPGKHSLEWDYFKYEYSWSGKDAAWIDLIKIPGTVSGIEQTNSVNYSDLSYNYPNPFNPTTVLNFNLGSRSEVFLEIYNIRGETVIQKDLGRMNKGMNSVRLNFDSFESGTYFYRINSKENVISGKLLFLK
ncbi:MAG: T9SS type A sorting domain-containing protein [Candidatus Delongbacteria bacterium]|nr:T9SS type A sorting domain-containing protein [Candidatus Delongbacteria bacterium]